MHIQTFIYPNLAIHSYVIEDEVTRECAVIDPPRVAKAIAAYISDKKLTLKFILETHVHADFVSGALELKKAFGQKPEILCSAEGGGNFFPSYCDKPVKNADILQIGSVELSALHTPGHTPEHMSWLIREKDSIEISAAFTGDFLFVGGVGRPDLLGDGLKQSLIEELHKSLFSRISSLPGSVIIYPSHGAGSMCAKAIGASLTSTLERERETSDAFKPLEKKAWAEHLEEGVGSPPKTFARNKKINLEGASMLSELSHYQFITEVSALNFALSQSLVIDFRDPLAFASLHIKGSINVPLSPAVGNWLAAVLLEVKPILCLLPKNGNPQEIFELIRILGYDQEVSFVEESLPLKEKEWLDNNEWLTKTELTRPEQLNDLIEKPNFFLLDVRTPGEWNTRHINGAHHIELNRLEASLDQIPKESEITVICGSGFRSSIAASLLKNKGFPFVSHVWGGMQAWSALCPAESVQ